MRLLDVATELGLDLPLLRAPLSLWDDGTTLHFSSHCPGSARGSWGRLTSRTALLSEVEPCLLCADASSLDVDLRRSLRLVLRSARLSELVDLVSSRGDAASYGELRALSAASSSLSNVRSLPPAADRVLSRAAALRSALESRLDGSLESVALTWAASELVGGGKRSKGVLTDPGPFEGLYPSPGKAVAMVHRVARRWKVTKRSAAPLEEVVSSCVAVLDLPDSPELRAAVLSVFSLLDEAFAALLVPAPLHVVSLRIRPGTLGGDDPLALVLSAFSSGAALDGGDVVLLAPPTVVSWLGLRAPYGLALAGPVLPSDTPAVFETMLALWRGASDGPLSDPANALEAARRI